MTISPPAKVKITPENIFQVLASGIDTLDLSIDVHWKDDTFFQYLEEMKSLAIQQENEYPIQFPGTEFFAVIQPYGRKGHKWIVNTGDFDMSIGDWLKPKSRPSIMLHIKSEALWREGARQLVDYLSDLLISVGAMLIGFKPSRIDLCLDMTFPSYLWNADLIPLRVTRSQHAAPYFDNQKMTGLSIGKGIVGARLYDKPLEISKKSHKFWMYDIWNIEMIIPEEVKIIRIEGQFRREALKELGLDQFNYLLDKIDNLWGYFTQEWLKFQDNPGKHHTMRSTLPWWEIVQNSFLGVQNPFPLLRCKIFHPIKKHLFAQSYGTMTSLLAAIHEENDIPIGCNIRIKDLLHEIDNYSGKYGKGDFELEADLVAKRAKSNRIRTKMRLTHESRIAHGFPSNIKPEYYGGQSDE